MARDDVFCAACQKLHGRKLAQKHERLLNAQPYPPQPILRRVGVTSRHGPAPDSDPIPEPVEQRGHDDEVPNNFMDNDMGAGTPPSSPQHSQRLPHGCFMVEEVDEDDEEEPDLEDVGMDDNDEDEFHFVNFDWDGLERDADGLTAMDRSSAAYHQRVSEITDKLNNLDRLICRAFAYKLRHHLTDEGFVDLPHVFEPDADHSQLSLAAVRTRVAFLSGFKPQFYDCCPKSWFAILADTQRWRHVHIARNPVIATMESHARSSPIFPSFPACKHLPRTHLLPLQCSIVRPIDLPSRISRRISSMAICIVASASALYTLTVPYCHRSISQMPVTSR
ncbi:hypothetical protein BDZ89DRAFT_62271 [Hymenopellis radicata]|nr:hypothetical protein BDZ89DRAFT_62271 [Hymenopellis radicata]